MVDIRERGALGQLPAMFRKLRSGHAGQHRSVTLAETIRKRLSEASLSTKVVHRDINR